MGKHMGMLADNVAVGSDVSADCPCVDRQPRDACAFEESREFIEQIPVPRLRVFPLPSFVDAAVLVTQRFPCECQEGVQRIADQGSVLGGGADLVFPALDGARMGLLYLRGWGGLGNRGLKERRAPSHARARADLAVATVAA
jgi:hypothetical protein